MTSCFLKGDWGWTRTDECWWCGTGKRQSRDHLFKERRKRMKEIKTPLEVGDISLGERSDVGKGTNAPKIRKDPGPDTEGKYKVRRNNTAVTSEIF